MTQDPQERDDFADWESDARDDAAPGETLVVDVEGFEGPLDLLLALARTQKVDLAKISVLALAQQYLDFIGEARRLRLEIAADYLVMAAWLAFLKSKLLLPDEKSEEGEPTGEELAALLAFRLKRLHAMREASAQLMTRKRLGRDIFARVDPEPIRARFAAWDGQSREATAAHHRIERWRLRLLDDDGALTEFAREHPRADLQRLRTCVREARKERLAGGEPRHFRDLFRLIREAEAGNGAKPPL